MYYNADLLEPQSPETTCLGFIDDIMYGVEGKSDKENAKKLHQILQPAEMWRLKHRAQFEPSKYVLVHFTRNTKRTTEVSLEINGIMINPAKEARYLGVTIELQEPPTKHRKERNQSSNGTGSHRQNQLGIPLQVC